VRRPATLSPHGTREIGDRASTPGAHSAPASARPARMNAPSGVSPSTVATHAIRQTRTRGGIEGATDFPDGRPSIYLSEQRGGGMRQYSNGAVIGGSDEGIVLWRRATRSSVRARMVRLCARRTGGVSGRRAYASRRRADCLMRTSARARARRQMSADLLIYRRSAAIRFRGERGSEFAAMGGGVGARLAGTRR
jgi:hypothetical protein